MQSKDKKNAMPNLQAKRSSKQNLKQIYLQRTSIACYNVLNDIHKNQIESLRNKISYNPKTNNYPKESHKA
ncbi:MAG: hypothetical protein SPF34_00745 [Helicobacter sp.]|nr:hypothetical protein [Helicobacter sp.]